MSCLRLFNLCALTLLWTSPRSPMTGHEAVAFSSPFITPATRRRQFALQAWNVEYHHDPAWAVRVAQEVQPSVVLVIPKGVRNMTARGSGFLLHGNETVGLRTHYDDDDEHLYAITAAHVAVPGYSIQVSVPSISFPEETTTSNLLYSASVVARNTTLDLALLRITNANTTTTTAGLALARHVPAVGTVALAHGYPASRLRGPTMTAGIVCGIADGLGLPEYFESSSRSSPSNIKTNIDTASFVVTDAAMSGGMSGGPLVDDRGTVIGVNALIRPGLRALGNYAVSSEHVIEFLKSVIASNNDDVAKERSIEFKVWLYNDRMNKRERVAHVLNKVALLDAPTANEVMMEAHRTGRGMVGTYASQAEAKIIHESLRDQDLLVEVE